MSHEHPRPGVDRRRFLEMAAVGTTGVAVAPLLGTATAATAAAAVGPAAGAPSRLLASLLPTGLGIETRRPRLSWQVPGLTPGSRQTHYHVQVATDPRMGRDSLVWDSGQVASPESVAVPYGGPELAPSTAYWWRVRTFDGHRASQWSEPALLATGVMGRWTGTPVWVPQGQAPGDGTFAVKVTILTVSAGLWFRASSSSENYLWQVMAGTPGRLKKHVFTGGSFRVLAEVPLPMEIRTGVDYDIAVTMTGSTFVTSINGTVVDTTTDSTHRRGAVGLRNGSTESQTYDRVTFTDSTGQVLLDDDFSTDRRTFGSGTVADGRLTLGRSQSGLASALGPDGAWALLRHEFTLPDKPVTAAILHVAAQSPERARQYVARVWCNGEHAGFASVRAPAGEPRYHSYEVTRLLRPGRANALAALCHATQDQRFLAQLEVTFADGTRRTIASGPHWKARRQAGLLPDRGDVGGGFYVAPQEYWDLRFEPAGWTGPGFDDSGWEAATAREPIAGLVPALTEPVRLVDVEPAKVTRAADGRWLVDLGREIVGGLVLEVTGRAGQTVEVRLGEELNADGTVRYQLRAANTYREVWTLRDGRQRIEHWGYRGFRYAELRCDPSLDLSSAVTGRTQRLDWSESDAAFHSSDPDLDRVYEFCRYSIEATRTDLYVDTPTRERGPYEGDAYVNQLSEYAVQRSYALARYSNRFLTRVPTWPTEYRLMSVLIAWQEYLHTGDPDQLAADYDRLVAKNLTGNLGEDGLVHKPSSQNGVSDLVDWPVSNRDGYVFTEVNTVVNAFQYAAFDTLAQVAGALGKKDDAARWRGLADRIARAMRDTLLDEEAGRFVDGAGTAHSAQHATVFPLALGVAGQGTVSDDVLRRLGRTLAEGGMKVSVYGAQFLLDALFACGRADAAIGLMTATSTNSWLHMLDDLGATIVGEAWDPALKPNMTFSHAWASAPANVLPRQVLGVRVTAPGAAAVDVRPRPGPLTKVGGRVPTIRGPIEVALDRTGPTGYRLEVEVPPNTSARLVVELGDDTAAAYHVTGPHARAPRQVDRDVTGGLLVIGPVGAGRTVVVRDGRR
ncbi:family 78 glycoside hydrolase catalytic domain [Thermomonospora echinospora]|uniref:family 78 glycoside hydrolase catalytic domain n=1 Tax=Thermomonospora echinospora TaxID=1992 RepID=UPI001F31C3BD|nr:family 78 glycoside hydrolase catalytic domain [Thermomonospora echinospora]